MCALLLSLMECVVKRCALDFARSAASSGAASNTDLKAGLRRNCKLLTTLFSSLATCKVATAEAAAANTLAKRKCLFEESRVDGAEKFGSVIDEKLCGALPTEAGDGVVSRRNFLPCPLCMLRVSALHAGYTPKLGLGFSVWGLGFGAWAPIGKSLTRIYPVQSERSGEYGTGA